MNFRGLLFIVVAAFLAPGVFATEASTEKAPTENAPQVAVVFETTMGEFTLELFPDKAPKTVANFLAYVDQGFYADTLFHRVIPGFVIQGGGFVKGMQQKQTNPPVQNESRRDLKNLRGTISMARTRDPHSATSQFFINVKQNISLDVRGEGFGYAVFGQVIEGMDVIDKIVSAPTKTLGPYENVPAEDIAILSVRREGEAAAGGPGPLRFMPGEHYVVLNEPMATRDSSKVEVVEAFSYGCPPCYGIEPLLAEWRKEQVTDVDFWHFPAVWNDPMKLYARAYYAAQELNVVEKTHLPLFTEVVVAQKKISNESELTEFFAGHGVEKEAFAEAFNSASVNKQVKEAEARVRSYKIGGAPEFIVNGKYRVDRARAGGLEQMLAIVDYLVAKERAALARR